MSDVIRFAPLNDGSEEECQCARCGSSAMFVHCDNCGGTGTIDGADWEGGYVEDAYTCDVCSGEFGWWVCLSDEQWCDAHPVEGRDHIERGKIEWFTIPERAR